MRSSRSHTSTAPCSVSRILSAAKPAVTSTSRKRFTAQATSTMAAATGTMPSGGAFQPKEGRKSTTLKEATPKAKQKAAARRR